MSKNVNMSLLTLANRIFKPIIVPAHDWVGFLADDDGRFQVESIKNGDFKAVLV